MILWLCMYLCQSFVNLISTYTYPDNISIQTQHIKDLVTIHMLWIKSIDHQNGPRLWTCWWHHLRLIWVASLLHAISYRVLSQWWSPRLGTTSISLDMNIVWLYLSFKVHKTVQKLQKKSNALRSLKKYLRGSMFY